MLSALAIVFLTPAVVMTYSIVSRLMPTPDGEQSTPVYEIELFVCIIAWALFLWFWLMSPIP